MTLKEQLAATTAAMRALMETVEKEGREVSPEEMEFLQAKSAESLDLKARMERADSAAAIFRGIESDAPEADDTPLMAAAKDLGEFALKSGLFDRWKEGTGRRHVSSNVEFKAAGDPFLTGTLGTTDYGRVVPATLRRLTVSDILASGTINGTTLTYWTQGAVTGAPAALLEGGAKPLMNFAFAQVVESLVKLAAITKVSDESMEDVAYLVSVIRSQLVTRLQVVEEDQLLNGSGTSPNLRGLLNRSGILTQGAVGDLKKDNADSIYKAITAIYNGPSQLSADAIVVNPANFQDLRLTKDSAGQYFAGGPFFQQYGNGPIPGIIEQPPIWGLRTVVTPAIAAGTALVGAFATAAQVFRKGGIRVDSTNTDVDDFQKNLVALRAEERLLLAVYWPSGFCKVTLGAA